MANAKRRAEKGLTWFTVKTLYRWSASGRPQRRDAAYDAQATMIEERVVIFRASSFEEAIKLAEREARAYARGVHYNLYDQKVRTRYLGACDAFELFEPPTSAVEVYSRTEVVNAKVSDVAIADALLGPRTERLDLRRKFVNRDLAGSTWPRK